MGEKRAGLESLVRKRSETRKGGGIFDWEEKERLCQGRRGKREGKVRLPLIHLLLSAKKWEWGKKETLGLSLEADCHSKTYL